MPVRFKLITVGDGGVGKSSMFATHTVGAFPSVYVPRVFDQHSVGANIDGTDVEMALYDTHGQEEYDRVRPLSYPATDVFFVCFSVDNRTSFDNVEAKWVKEVEDNCPGIPMVLVACKIDMRKNPNIDTVSCEEGLEVAKRNGLRYCETSSMKHKGLKHCFDEAMRSALNCRIRNKKDKKEELLNGLKKFIAV